MRILFATDSFKGSLSSARAAELLDGAAHEVFGECETIGVPIADGGEGTVDAVLEARRGERIYVRVNDPLMRPIEACYGRLSDDEAIIEMAEASGLTLLTPAERDPLSTSSFGTGELVRHALDSGFKRITLAIGGSATNDGGMGFARALGVRFLDENGNELGGCGRDLERVADIDISGIDSRIRDTRFTVMCDVNNPLCGERGATRIFGPQKGGTPEVLDRLERGMDNYRRVIVRSFRTDPDETPGSGAAGGLGAALMIYLGAKMQRGIDAVLDLIGFEELLKGTDLVITGEGRTDHQSSCGKVMDGVGSRAKKLGVSAIGLCGGLAGGYEEIFGHGIDSIMTTVNAPMPLEEAMRRADELYYDAAVRMFRLIRTGMKLGSAPEASPGK